MERKDSTSTATSLDDENTENFGSNPTRDILAEGILNLFKPSIDKLDESVQSARDSQQELKVQLESLLKQLQEIEASQDQMPEFSGKVKELINIKHKVSVITNVLQTTQERLINLHQLIEKEEAKRRNLLDIIMETPSINHLTPQDYQNIYEPAEDSFLLLDALEKDLDYIQKKLSPKVCLEIGSGSGIIITSIAKYVKGCLCLSTDINNVACSVTKRTASANPPAKVDSVQMNLVDGIRDKSVDLLLFNPPYVVTSDEELETSKMVEGDGVTSKNLVYTWAGGEMVEES
uniref:Methyltransferase small domain-containing protein n=1 Tax=Megaselia scalaris TaxID=36166 RepID=T1GC44_MEGSC